MCCVYEHTGNKYFPVGLWGRLEGWLSWVCGSIHHCWVRTSPTPLTSPRSHFVRHRSVSLCSRTFRSAHSTRVPYWRWWVFRKVITLIKQWHPWISDAHLLKSRKKQDPPAYWGHFFLFTKKAYLSQLHQIIRKYQPKDFSCQWKSPLVKVPNDQKFWDVYWFRAYVPQEK